MFTDLQPRLHLRLHLTFSPVSFDPKAKSTLVTLIVIASIQEAAREVFHVPYDAVFTPPAPAPAPDIVDEPALAADAEEVVVVGTAAVDDDERSAAALLLCGSSSGCLYMPL
jgi:hypothetical protein